jgi:hypothetical protein
MLRTSRPQSWARSAVAEAEMNCFHGLRPSSRPDSSSTPAQTFHGSRHQDYQAVDLAALNALQVGGDIAMMGRGAIAGIPVFSEADQALSLLFEFLDAGRIAPGGLLLGQLDYLGMPFRDRRMLTPLQRLTKVVKGSLGGCLGHLSRRWGRVDPLPATPQFVDAEAWGCRRARDLEDLADSVDDRDGRGVAILEDAQ